LRDKYKSFFNLNSQMIQSQTAQKKHSSQLIFLYPKDLKKSFLHSYDDCLGERTIGSILKAIKEEKKCSMKFTDVFGRRIQKDMTEEQFRALQPFYIKKMTPKEKKVQHVEDGVLLYAEAPEFPEKGLLELIYRPSDLIKSLKEEICEMFKIEDEKSYFLLWKGVILGHNRTLAECGIPLNSASGIELSIIKEAWSGGCSFVDLTNDDKVKVFDWSKNAPWWRMAAPGLCLEGKCQNLNCEALDKWVIIPKGTGVYDLIYDDHTNQCPMCSSYVKVEKCAFNNCTYRYTGIKMQGDGKPAQKVTCQNEIGVGNHYKLFDPEIVGNANWTTLKIETKARYGGTGNEQVSCGLCTEPIIEGLSSIEYKSDCSHSFHKECSQSLNESFSSDCVVCLL